MEGYVQSYHMYHIYLEQMIFTKLFTPRKFDKYLQLRRLRLW